MAGSSSIEREEQPQIRPIWNHDRKDGGDADDGMCMLFFELKFEGALRPEVEVLAVMMEEV